MKYPVKITQVLEGYVEIEAESRDAALRQADDLYNRQGRELPDMEDGNPLTFSCVGEPEREVSAAVEEAASKNTMISYLYRDADNYKVHNECIISGVLTPEQQQTILSCLDQGEYFIPQLVGLPEKRFDDYDEEVDHPWFELDEYSFEETSHPASVNVKAEDLVQAFLRCKDRWEWIPLNSSMTNEELCCNLSERLFAAIRDGSYATWEDLCAEYPINADYDPVAGSFRPGYGLVVWGEETDAGEKYFSVSVHKLDSNLEPDEKILTSFSDSDDFNDLETAVYDVLHKLDNYLSTHPVFINTPTEFSLSQGSVKVEWEDLDEGLRGDYNPDDPSDISLLRFTVSVLRDGQWEQKDDASYCTTFPADATEEQKKQGLEILFREFYDALKSDVNVSVKKLGERLSWIGLDNLPKPKVEKVSLASLISSAEGRAGGSKPENISPAKDPER